MHTMNRQEFDPRCKIDAENWSSQNSSTAWSNRIRLFYV